MVNLSPGQKPIKVTSLAAAEEPETRLSLFGRYILASLLPFAALIVLFLLPVLFRNSLNIPFFIAVGVSAWICGFAPSLVTTLISVILGVFLADPVQNLGGLNTAAYLRIGTFIIIALLINLPNIRRRNIEDRLREQREWFRVCLSGIGDAVIATDTAERIVFMNPVAEALTGWKQSEVTGKPIETVFNIVNENTRQPVEHPISQVLSENRVVGLARHTILIARNGLEKPIDDSGAPIMNAEGDVIGAVLVFRDITDHKRAEDTQAYLAEAGRVLASSLDYETTLKNIANLAVPTIADWCVINILDEQGELHELALAHKNPEMQKLVEEYREKYPPDPDQPNVIANVARANQPVLIEKITDEMVVQAAPDAHALELLRRLQLKSALYVPIAAHGSVLGVLALSSGDSGRSFGEEYLPLAEELARRAATAIENARLYQSAQQELKQRTIAERELAASEAQLRLVTDALPVLISYVDTEYRYQFNNQAYEEWFGVTQARALGKPMPEIIGEPAFQALKPYIDAALKGEKQHFEIHVDYKKAGLRDIEVTYIPDVAENNSVQGMFVLVSDVTERKRAEQVKDFLAESSRLLASSLDYQTTLKNIASMSAPTMCDWCTIDVLEHDGNLQQLVAAHADPAKRQLVEEFRQVYASTTRPSSLTQQIIRNKQAVFMPDVSDEWLREMIPDEEAYQLIKQLQLKSILSVPISLRGEILGVLNFRFGESGRAFTQADLETAEELARRAAVAIENARLYESAQREIKERKQAEERTAILYRIARGFSEAITPEQIINQLLSQGLDALGVGAGVIGLLNDEETGLQIVSFHNVAREVESEYRFIPLTAPTAISDAARTGEAVWLPSFEAYTERYPKNINIALEQGTQAAFGLPLIVDGRVIGAMAFDFRTPQALDQDERDFWLGIAQQTAQALDRARLYQETHQAREWLEVTLSSIGDGVIATDNDQKITFMNPIAAGLTAWTVEDALGQPIDKVFHIVNEDTRQLVENPVVKVLREGRIVGLANHTILIGKNGVEFPIDDSGAPIRDHQNQLIGAVLVFRDITARKAAEEQLRESENRFRVMAETVPDILYTNRADGSPDYISHRFYEFTGIPTERALAEGSTIALHPDDVHANLPRLLESREAGIPFEGQYRFRMSDGSYRWFVSRTRPIRDEHNRIVKWVGSSTDIHDIKQTQEELIRLTNLLEQGRQRLRNILSNVPGVVWEAWGQPDLTNQRIDFVSDYVETMLGYSVDEWLNTPNFWLTIVHPEDRERAAAEATAIFNNRGPGTSRFRWMTKDGRAIPVEAQSTVIIDGNGSPLGMRGVTMDISERESAERERMMLFHAQQLAIRQKDEAYALLDALFSSAPVGLAFFDKDIRFQRINPALAEINGLAPEAHIGHTPRELLPDVEVEGTEGQFLTVLETGEAATFETSGFTRATPGEMRYWFASYYPIRLQDEVLGIGAVVLDITERKLIEKQRVELLERERAAREAAEEADRLKLTFLAMISHELRTPLTSIKGFATTLLADDITWDAESQRDFIAIISEEADKLTDLIEQLLDLSRLEAGTLSITPERLTVMEMISASMAQLETITANHNLMIDIAHDTPLVMADARRIGQVIVNLVNNAAKYSPVETGIRISAQQHDDLLQINIVDEGPGIPQEERSIVFEAFRQVESKGSSYKKGAGLGLAICKGVVEAHGGTIWIEDTETGTTISFTIRIAE